VTASPLRVLRLAARDGAAVRAAPAVPAAAPRFDAAELVARARARDPRAAAQIWDHYAPTVRGVLYRSVGPDGDVDDLMQEVFVGFFRNVGGLRDPAALKPFLIGIALRTARAALRKRRVRRWLRLTPTGEPPEVEATTADPRTREALRRLFVVLDELAARDRLAFVLRHGEEYELTEVASALACSLATVKRCLARAEAHVLARARVDVLLAPYAREEGGIHDTP
jgi:RNA polymerase sigma-70 factor, ECF subfamily